MLCPIIILQPNKTNKNLTILMATRNHHCKIKENNKNSMNNSRTSLNPEEESRKRRPSSAKYDDL